MIVVCTGCSAKFRVAEEKVGPRGAKLRCSKCQTIFSVQRPGEPSPPGAAADHGASVPAAPQRAAPPPLPRRASTLDARAAFEVDLEPHHGAFPAPADPFGPAPPERGPVEWGAPVADPFDLPPGGSAPHADPFGSPPADLQADPFAASTSVSFEPPGPFSRSPPAGGGADSDPFGQPPVAPSEPLDGFGSWAPSPGARATGAGPGSSLSLEESTAAPPRREAPPTGPAPMPTLDDLEDPFGSRAPLETGVSDLGDGVLSGPGSAPPSPTPIPIPASARPEADLDQPLQLDPIGAAAIAADHLAVADPRRGTTARAPAEPTLEQPLAVGSFRLRDVLVSAMALAVLLLLAVAILVAWNGGLASSEVLRPSGLLGALAHRSSPGPLTASDVSSGLYDRARGRPLLFVRGTVTSTASTTLEEVRVTVEVVRDGAVLLRGEMPVGDVPGAEALYGAVDATALAKAFSDAATPGSARLVPGASAPFLLTFADYPANLAGASLAVRPLAGSTR